MSANAHAAAGGPGLRGAAAEEDDVLLINVGGERFTTTRYVLPAYWHLMARPGPVRRCLLAASDWG